MSNTLQKKISDINPGYYCSITGICLTPDEIRKIVEREYNNVKQKDDFYLHEYTIHLLQKDPLIAQSIYKALNKKHKLTLKKYLALDCEKQIRETWQQDWKAHNFSDSYWALMSHPLVKADLLDEVYGAMHMLLFAQLETLQIKNMQVKQLQVQKQQLQQEIKALTQKNQAYINEKNLVIHKLYKEIDSLHREKKTLETPPSIKVTNISQAEIIKLKKVIQQLEQEKQDYKKALENSQIAIEDKQAIIANLKQQLQQQVIEEQTQNRPQENVFNLQGQKILYVGGHKHLTPHFKDITEKYNGEFFHHDGGMEMRFDQLNSCLTKANAVFCPIDCISHNACKKIKRLCKQKDIPCIFLRSASLSAFNKGIEEMVA